MEGQILISMKELITLVGVVVVPLVSAIIFLWKRGEAKNKTIIDLTKSFTEVTKDHIAATKDCTRAVDNNTQVIGKLPETIMLHMAAQKKGYAGEGW